MLGKRAQGKTCEAIKGIIEEGKEIIEDFADSPALDAGLLSAAQAVEHYEITRYGTLKAWAEKLGMNDAVRCSTLPSRRRRKPTTCSPDSPRRGSTSRRRRRRLQPKCLSYLLRPDHADPAFRLPMSPSIQ